VPPTIYDIAERAGVSTATVSRVFNDSSSVSEDTRADVMKAAQSLGYKPHASAQSLAGQRTHLIAAVVPILANHFYLGVMRGMQEALSTSDFDLLVYTPSHPMEVEEQIKRASQRGRSDGLLMLSAPITDDMAAHREYVGRMGELVEDEFAGHRAGSGLPGDCELVAAGVMADAGSLIGVLADPHGYGSVEVVLRREEVPRAEKRLGRPALHVDIHSTV